MDGKDGFKCQLYTLKLFCHVENNALIDQLKKKGWNLFERMDRKDG